VRSYLQPRNCMLTYTCIYAKQLDIGDIFGIWYGNRGVLLNLIGIAKCGMLNFCLKGKYIPYSTVLVTSNIWFSLPSDSFMTKIPSDLSSRVISLQPSGDSSGKLLGFGVWSQRVHGRRWGKPAVIAAARPPPATSATVDAGARAARSSSCSVRRCRRREGHPYK